VATYDEGKLAVFLVNRSTEEPVEVTIDTSRTPVTGVLEALSLHDDNRLAVNTAEHPDRVVPKSNDSVRLDSGRLTVTLPPISWTALSLSTR
jgi:alpha-N-arabinofuranosidase